MDEKRKEKLMVGLKENIRQYLDLFCTADNTPYICKLKQTQKGYKEIQDFVFEAFFKTDMTINEALVEKENMLNPNYLTD